MTAIKDAMERAGMNTALARLKVLASEAMRLHKTPEKALRFFWRAIKNKSELCDALALDFLSRVEIEPGTKTAGPQAGAAARAAAESAKTVEVDEYKRRPPSAKAAARIAAQVGAAAMADAFNARHFEGRAIGDLTWKELGRLVANNAMSAASYLRLGTEATENALLLHKIASWATVSDPSMRVRDIIKAEQLAIFISEAKREAPAVVERGMRDYAATIEHQQAKELTHG